MTDKTSKRIEAAIDDSADAVKSSARDLKSGAEEIADTATRRVKDTAGDMKDGVSEIAGAARDTAERTAAAVSERVDRASETLRDAADSLRDGSLGDRTFGQLAASLADASDAIRDKDLAQLSRDARNFARSNPMLFVGGAALLGFAVARMMSNTGDDA